MEELQTQNKMLYVSFNNTSSLFAIGTETGFQIFNPEEFTQIISQNMNGGIAMIEMLNSSNIIALVGGGNLPKYSPTKVIIYDIKLHKEVAILRFGTNIKNIKLCNDKIIVVCDSKIYLFSIKTLDNIDTISTCRNKRRLIAVGHDNEQSLTRIAFPLEQPGKVGIRVYNVLKNNEWESFEIQAHGKEVACLCMNRNGSLLATASIGGTIIRVFNMNDGNLVKELRRGSENADIYSISIDNSFNYLACTSDRGTVHVFYIGSEEGDRNRKSVWRKIFSNDKSYFNSEWSFSKYKMGMVKSIVSFGNNNNIYLITAEGKFYDLEFVPGKVGECIKKKEEWIIYK